MSVLSTARAARPRSLAAAGAAALLVLVAVQALMVLPAPAKPRPEPGRQRSSGTVQLPLHQDPPVVNSEYGEQGDCGGSPRLWGWHFVLTGPSATFVSLTTTFATAGTVVTTSFGPPSAKHAYVYTATDDTLLSASATVANGADLDWFNLSHTCAGPRQVGGSPSPLASVTVGGSPSPSASPEVSPSEGAGGSPSPEVSAGGGTTSLTTRTFVGGVKLTRPGVLGGSLTRTGAPLPIGLLLLLGIGLVVLGFAMTVSAPRGAGSGGPRRH